MRGFGSVLVFAALGLLLSFAGLLGLVGLASTAEAPAWSLLGLWRHVYWSQPLWFLMAAVPFLALGFRRFVRRRPATFEFSRVGSLQRLGATWGALLVDLPDGFRLAAGVLLAAAL